MPTYKALSSYTVESDGGVKLVSVVGVTGSGASVFAEGNSVFRWHPVVWTTCCRSDLEYSVDDYELGPAGELPPDHGRGGGLSWSWSGSVDVVAWSSRFLYVSSEHDRIVVVVPRVVLRHDPFAREETILPGLVVKAITVSPSGQMLYLLGSNASDEFAIQAHWTDVDGYGDRAQEVPLPSGLSGAEITVHPSGRYLYVPASPERLLVFSADDAGSLSLHSSLPAGVAHVTPHPNGRLLYATTAQEITTYSIDPA
ncbi:MAG TPA: hypothetical protein VI669_00275, partial [Vicinamibacteria bacterium]